MFQSMAKLSMYKILQNMQIIYHLNKVFKKKYTNIILKKSCCTIKMFLLKNKLFYKILLLLC